MKKSIMASLLLAATLFSSDMAAQEKYVYNEFYFQRSSLFSELPVGKKDIVFLGDSQTNGCEWHELLGMKNVKNRGISSDVIQGFIDRVDPIVEGQPAKVFILGGVNDISHDLTPDNQARVATHQNLLAESVAYRQQFRPLPQDGGQGAGDCGDQPPV